MHGKGAGNQETSQGHTQLCVWWAVPTHWALCPSRVRVLMPPQTQLTLQAKLASTGGSGQEHTTALHLSPGSAQTQLLHHPEALSEDPAGLGALPRAQCLMSEALSMCILH